MAENETLDIRYSGRWIPVIRSIREGRPADEIECEIKDAFLKSWTAIRKQFRNAGFTLEQVLDAAVNGDRAFLDRAYRDSKYHRFIRLIEGCSGFMEGTVDVLERTINSQLRAVRDQIRDVLVSRGDCADFGAADRRVSTPFRNVSPAATEFARRLLDAPAKAARLMAKVQPTEMPAPSLLHVSLINPASPPVGIGR
jgi:hypothetical protein